MLGPSRTFFGSALESSADSWSPTKTSKRLHDQTEVRNLRCGGVKSRTTAPKHRRVRDLRYPKWFSGQASTLPRLGSENREDPRWSLRGRAYRWTSRRPDRP